MPQPGQPNADDTVCQPVGRHQVRIRHAFDWPAPLMTCPEARVRVQLAGAGRLRESWTFIFAHGHAAVTVEQNNFTGESTPSFAGSAAFPGNRTVQVRLNGLGEGALEHEVQHARAAEGRRKDPADSFAGREWY